MKKLILISSNSLGTGVLLMWLFIKGIKKDVRNKVKSGLPLLVGLVMVFCSFSGNAQSQVEISGQVKDYETKENLLYSKITVINEQDSIINGGITDEKGFFKIPFNPCPCRLVISSLGYQNDTVSIPRLREDSFLGVFKLHEDVLNLAEVEVIGNARTERLDKDVQLVTKELRNGATAAKDVLNKITGISYDDYAGILKVDGDANIMILVNGVEKSQEYIQNLNPERLLKVETSRDPGGRYGLEGYTAILNIILKTNYTGTEVYMEEMQVVDINTDKKNLQLLVGSIGGTYNYTRDNLNIYGGLRLRRKHFQITTESMSEYEDGLVVSENAESTDPNGFMLEYNARYNLGFDYRINPKHIISFESNLETLPFGGEQKRFDYVTQVYSNDTLIDQYNFGSNANGKKWDTYNSLFYVGEFNKSNKLSINYTYSNYRESVSNNTLQEGAYSREETGVNKKQFSRFYAEFDHVFSPKMNIQFGYGNTWRELNNVYHISQMDISSKQTITFSNDFQLSDTRHKLYSNISWKMNKKWGMRAGIALETSSPRGAGQQFNYLIYQPLVDLKYDISKKVNVKFKYRVSSDYPTIAQTNPFVSQVNPRITSTGNPFLRPSSTHRLSIRLNVLRGLIAFEPYLHYSNNKIARIGDLGADNIFDYRFENVDSYQRVGGKLNFSKYFKKASFLIKSNVEVFQARIESTSGVNEFVDWKAGVDLMYIFPKTKAILGLKYQHEQTKRIRGLGYEKGDVDFWMLFYKQPLFKKKASVMFGYFLPITLGANYNQESHVETTGFTMSTSNDVSLVKNMFILEFSYRFGKGDKVKKKQKEINQESEGGGGGPF
ncbi:MAG: outer membrane beta-barrel protein [Crocinitomix sp.]|nr:outer membrane beta-barrel protein [Crocinitomix sp.]